MKHLWKVLSVLLALAMLPFATASASESVKIGVIYTVAGLGGASFNDVIHEGCQRAEKELGITYEYVEPSTIADEETVMDEMCISGEYALIICVGNEQKDAVSTVAANYPDQKFCYIDASVDLPNVANYECKENEGGFLIGALCALAEKEGLSPMFNAEKKFGFLGGVNNAIINRFAAGFLLIIAIPLRLTMLVALQTQHPPRRKLQQCSTTAVTWYSMRQAAPASACLMQLRSWDSSLWASIRIKMR